MSNERFYAMRDNINHSKMDTSEQNDNETVAVIDKWKPSVYSVFHGKRHVMTKKSV